jgi:hypothetical protein
MEADRKELLKARVLWRLARCAYFIGLEKLGDKLMNKSGEYLCKAFWMIEDCE